MNRLTLLTGCVAAAVSLALPAWMLVLWLRDRGVNPFRALAKFFPRSAADGSIVTNAVFARGVSAMFGPTISDYDKADILAFHIPAVSSPAGKVEVIGSRQGVAHDFNLNGDAYRANDWGREGILVTDGEGQQHIETPWLHSDIKNMAYYYVYPAFTNIVEKGAMK